jgi:hypothetical protein
MLIAVPILSIASRRLMSRSGSFINLVAMHFNYMLEYQWSDEGERIMWTRT